MTPRKLVVSNFVTVDGLYDGPDKNIGPLFQHVHPDYAGDDAFDHFTTPTDYGRRIICCTAETPFWATNNIGPTCWMTQTRRRNGAKLPR
jgi:hypothetical protein